MISDYRLIRILWRERKRYLGKQTAFDIGYRAALDFVEKEIKGLTHKQHTANLSFRYMLIGWSKGKLLRAVQAAYRHARASNNQKVRETLRAVLDSLSSPH